MATPKPGTNKTGEPSWLWRRLLTYVTVIVCFWLIYILINAPDTRVNDTIAWSLCMVIVLLVMTYTGAATAQDIVAMMTMRTARPYADAPLPPTPPAPQPLPDQTVIVQQAPGGPAMPEPKG
jgi:hypothetical protein